MAVCALCGKFNYDYGRYDCPHCAKLWRKDQDEGRLPPPITDPRDLFLELWIKIRCTERAMTEAGSSKEEIRKKIIEMATPYAGLRQQGDQKARELQQRSKDHMKRIQDYYSY